jgi:glycosyltransferase involved in cell wall biosynthesis
MLQSEKIKFMRIGFDAKRAFYNRSGLGNYSRSTIGLLQKYFPKNEYFLYTPSVENSISFPLDENTKTVTPKGFINKLLNTYWRSFKLSKNIKKDKLDIYHGLSNEVPQNANKTGAKIFTTIHDLFFFRYPELFNTADRKIYSQKFKYSAQISNKVIAISEQTKTDIIHYLDIDSDKIEVIYQGCNPIFGKDPGTEKKIEVAQKYNLPKQYILNVGTVEKRKNILTVVKALYQNKIDIPLIIIGGRTYYQTEIEKYIAEHAMENQVRIYNHVSSEDLPTLYQLSELFIFPSLFEGFGIPILEALNSKTPVITTRGGCFSEAGGQYSVYVKPDSEEEIGAAVLKILSDSAFRNIMIEEGFRYAQKFSEDKIAENLMKTYINGQR